MLGETKKIEIMYKSVAVRITNENSFRFVLFAFPFVRQTKI